MNESNQRNHHAGMAWACFLLGCVMLNIFVPAGVMLIAIFAFLLGRSLYLQ